MANTTNFGWETPDDTDLVKDGAASIRTLGSAIDTSLVDLKGGTTGQVLSKASNTDLDFTWTNGGDITEVSAGTGISGGGTSGAVTITNSMATAIDAKGDLIAGTGADAFSRLAVGTNGQYLIADSTTATGLKWGDVSAGLTSLASGSLSGSSVSITSITGTYNYLILLLQGARTSQNIVFRFNSDSGSNYEYVSINSRSSSVITNTGTIEFYWDGSGNLGTTRQVVMTIPFYANTSTHKNAFIYGGMGDGVGNFTGRYYSTSAITSIQMVVTGGSTFSGGTYTLYGAN